MGNLSLRYGNFADAARYFRKGVLLIVPLVRADPQDVDARDALNTLRANLGLSLARTGKQAEGLGLLDESYADATDLGRSAQNAQYRSSAAAIGLELAFALESGGEPVRARELYLLAADIYRSILVTEPANTENLIAQSVALNRAASAGLRRGNFSAAQDGFAQALKINEPLAAGNADALYAVAATYMGLGDVARATSRASNSALQRLELRRQADAWYRKCLELARRIPNLSPVDPWGLDSVDAQVIASRLAESRQNPSAP
jgi:tetratricopeptide (TPR) repeat protein